MEEYFPLTAPLWQGEGELHLLAGRGVANCGELPLFKRRMDEAGGGGGD